MRRLGLALVILIASIGCVLPAPRTPSGNQETEIVERVEATLTAMAHEEPTATRSSGIPTAPATTRQSPTTPRETTQAIRLVAGWSYRKLVDGWANYSGLLVIENVGEKPQRWPGARGLPGFGLVEITDAYVETTEGYTYPASILFAWDPSDAAYVGTRPCVHDGLIPPGVRVAGLWDREHRCYYHLNFRVAEGMEPARLVIPDIAPAPIIGPDSGAWEITYPRIEGVSLDTLPAVIEVPNRVRLKVGPLTTETRLCAFGFREEERTVVVSLLTVENLNRAYEQQVRCTFEIIGADGFVHTPNEACCDVPSWQQMPFQLPIGPGQTVSDEVCFALEEGGSDTSHDLFVYCEDLGVTGLFAGN